MLTIDLYCVNQTRLHCFYCYYRVVYFISRDRKDSSCPRDHCNLNIHLEALLIKFTESGFFLIACRNIVQRKIMCVHTYKKRILVPRIWENCKWKIMLNVKKKKSKCLQQFICKLIIANEHGTNTENLKDTKELPEVPEEGGEPLMSRGETTDAIRKFM